MGRTSVKTCAPLIHRMRVAGSPKNLDTCGVRIPAGGQQKNINKTISTNELLRRKNI